MSKAYKILLVEDNVDDEHLSLRVLRRLPSNPEIVIARDGAEALELLQDSGESLPDLVLLDLKLPKINGLDVLLQLRRDSRTANLLVVALASSDAPPDVRAICELHASAMIRKPVDCAELGAVLSELGVNWVLA